MPSQQSDLWVQCADAPDTLLNWKASRWDSNNFVIAEDCEVKESNGSKGVYKYNVIRDEWTLFVKYPKLYHPLYVSSIAVDPNRHRLYISGTNYPLILCYTKAKRVRTTIDNMRRPISPLVTLKKKEAMVITNGFLHSLDGYSIANGNNRFTKTHSIWATTSEMEYVPTFDEFVQASNFNIARDVFGRRKLALDGIELVHVPSQNIVLLIGDHRCGAIWKYEIDSKLWTPTGIHFDDFPVSAVLTASEKEIVIGGSKYWHDTDEVNKFYIVNIEDPANYSLHNCLIECPERTGFMMSKTGGEIHGELLMIG